MLEGRRVGDYALEIRSSNGHTRVKPISVLGANNDLRRTAILPRNREKPRRRGDSETISPALAVIAHALPKCHSLAPIDVKRLTSLMVQAA